jgi:hypothetical protein
MPDIVAGIVRDGRIVLVDGTELPDGQHVQVVIEPHPTSTHAAPAPEEGTIYTPVESPALAELLACIRRDRPPLLPGPSGPGRKSAAGMLADDLTWDEHLREVLDSRKSATDRELPE